MFKSKCIVWILWQNQVICGWFVDFCKVAQFNVETAPFFFQSPPDATDHSLSWNPHKWTIAVFLLRREPYCGEPRLTRASWRPWRRRWRTSAMTWTLPKAWTPTKMRSITLQTEWPRLSDRLPQKCLLPPVPRCVILHKSHCPAHLLLFLSSPLSSDPPVWPPLSSMKPWDACDLHVQPCVNCAWQSVIRAAVPSSFCQFMSAAIICTDAPF